jgi:hypothetical protein
MEKEKVFRRHAPSCVLSLAVTVRPGTRIASDPPQKATKSDDFVAFLLVFKKLRGL